MDPNWNSPMYSQTDAEERLAEWLVACPVRLGPTAWADVWHVVEREAEDAA